jgi:hypothetical protein
MDQERKVAAEMKAVAVAEAREREMEAERAAKIEAAPVPAAEAEAAPATEHAKRRLPALDRCVAAMIGSAWASEVRQIPATVIDKGILRNVPYASYRSGDYEMNVYGDPEAPVCVEIGIYGDLLTSEEAKANCREFLKSVLPARDDGELLECLELAAARKVRAGLTFEITPETAEDAYGGWWVSVYDEKALDASRASAAELGAISEKVEEIRARPPASPPKAAAVTSWSGTDLARSRRLTQSHSTAPRVFARSFHRHHGTFRIGRFGRR